MLCKRTCLVLPIHWIFPDLFWRVFLIWQLTCSVWPSRTRNSASWPIRQSWGLLFSVLTFNPISAVSRQAAAACLVGHKQLRLLLCRLLLPCLTEHAPYTTIFLCNTRLPDNHEKLTMIWWSSWDIVEWSSFFLAWLNTCLTGLHPWTDCLISLEQYVVPFAIYHTLRTLPYI